MPSTITSLHRGQITELTIQLHYNICATKHHVYKQHQVITSIPENKLKTLALPSMPYQVITSTWKEKKTSVIIGFNIYANIITI